MIFDSQGRTFDKRVECPTGDLRLEDGRALKFRGPTPVTGVWWSTQNGLRVIAGSEEAPKHGRLLHVSFSYANRLPSWEDVKAVRAVFFPDDVDVMMVLPKARDYVNIHNWTFHLWQTPTAWEVS